MVKKKKLSDSLSALCHTQETKIHCDQFGILLYKCTWCLFYKCLNHGCHYFQLNDNTNFSVLQILLFPSYNFYRNKLNLKKILGSPLSWCNSDLQSVIMESCKSVQHAFHSQPTESGVAVFLDFLIYCLLAVNVRFVPQLLFGLLRHLWAMGKKNITCTFMVRSAWVRACSQTHETTRFVSLFNPWLYNL